VLGNFMLNFSYFKHVLNFNFDARTSRGALREHVAFIIKVVDTKKPQFIAYGEASPLAGLSIDANENFEKDLQTVLNQLNVGVPLELLQLEKLPALNFALETALLDLRNGAMQLIFKSDFLEGKAIRINGLVWISDKESMLKSVAEKVNSGFDCIKLKIGSLDFDDECRLLEDVRKKYLPSKVEIRLDANGAFLAEEALEKLKELSRFEVQSIEQPIKPGQEDSMQEICAKSKIPIALDEELIGRNVELDGKKLLKHIKPKFIILKPTLLGGLAAADKWIEIAQKLEIDYWATSALESNIGLNAIAQWVATKDNSLAQGLGTGSLYSNNFTSPLFIKKGYLDFDKTVKFNLREY